MAGGWSRDGAVQEQIDDSVQDAVQLARSLIPSGEGTDRCVDCDETSLSNGAKRFPACARAWSVRRFTMPAYAIPRSIGGVARTANSADLQFRKGRSGRAANEQTSSMPASV